MLPFSILSLSYPILSYSILFYPILSYFIRKEEEREGRRNRKEFFKNILFFIFMSLLKKIAYLK